MNYETEILFQLRGEKIPRSASWICAQIGINRNRRGSWSNTAYRKYGLIGRALQKMKRAGKVEYVGGKGAGWKLVRRGR
jgi:hypothetical protein